ncbi:uncharacterized protein [Epargyreus clarus]|uniref:uncharacterized protein n=1 Tax=Epargyreus clarus TaxID=520877 RepID=UPI003C2CB31B
MNSELYFSQYESPNIVIIPNMSPSNPPSPKRRKMSNNILVPLVDNSTCEKIKLLQEQDQSRDSNICADKKVDKIVNSPKNPVKKASWASNYLQSIGLDSKSSIWQHKIPRKNASKRCVSGNTLVSITPNVTPNSTSPANTESKRCDQSTKIKPIMHLKSLGDKSNQESKHLTETQKTKKQNKKDKYLPNENTQLQKKNYNTVTQKNITNSQNNIIDTTFSSTRKNKNNIKLPKLKTDNIIKSNLIKQPIDDCAGCSSWVENHRLSKQSEKAVKTQKQPNFKTLPNHSNTKEQEKSKQRALNKVVKPNKPVMIKSNYQEDEIKHSVKNTSKVNKKCMEKSKPSTSNSSDNLKTKYKTQKCSIGQVTSVKSVVKVTKKYDINDLSKLTASKKINKTDLPTNSAACNKENSRKDTKDILTKKKLDSKARSINHKNSIKSPIKKQSQKTKEYRKIKLVINVVYNNKPIPPPGNSNDSNKVNSTCVQQNVDLDFLNDFDVDEIVQSLDICDREMKKMQTEMSLKTDTNKNNSDVNCNMSPGAYENDALDLIKILKGEEDDDLIKQSIEGAKELQLSSNIHTHTTHIENYNKLDKPEIRDKIDIMSNNEVVVPIKIKEEKQDIVIPRVVTDLHNVTEATYYNRNNCGNKLNYKQDTPDLCSGTIENLDDSITENKEINSKVGKGAKTSKQETVNNNIMDSETNTDLNKHEESKNEIISANSENNIETEEQESIDNMTNDASMDPVNADNKQNQHSDRRETNIIENIQQEKKNQFYNDKDESIENQVKQTENTNNQSQNKTDTPDRKTEQENIGSQNLITNHENKTTVSDNVIVDKEFETTVTQSMEIKDVKYNESEIHIQTSFPDVNHIVPQQIVNDNKQEENSEVKMKPVSNMNAVHKKPTNPEKQSDEKYPKDSNDEEMKADKRVDKDYNKSKPKANSDCLSAPTTLLSDDKINKKGLLMTPYTSKNSNMKMNIARKLEQRMFAYLGTKYSILTTIHQGKFSRIFKCKHPSGKLYALKSLNAKKHTMNMTKKHMMYSLQNGRPKNDLFTVYLVSAFSFANKWYILMDYYQKNLEQVLTEANEPFCIERVQEYARQLVGAVMALKSNNMVHSDIKPRHILINSFNNTLKLCGFDNLSYVNQIKVIPSTGTASYRAPEIILGYSAGFEMDVWSTALVLYEMAVNRKLLPGLYNNDILYKQICTLGTVPNEMIKKSKFASSHFCGTMFMKRFGFKGQKISIINNFVRNNKLKESIYNAYYHYWADQRSRAQQDYDMKKLVIFITLLEKMLVMHPRYRISIEYVFNFDNTFINDGYECNDW